ncbi:unnamed protein product [Allacma fusca]|uniref:Uncharacterized protein n=1 Tax=Allacma fusca TaxID=39272 RepID=A0A8J2LNH5_9HEXA|nr:unnamed protein product [Allacma fusca]
MEIGEHFHPSPTIVVDRGSTGGSRPPSRVRVTFFESEKPLAVSSPESDIVDFDLSNMTLPGSPSAVDRTPPAYNRQMSTESGWDNPFRPDGDLSKEADQIVELIKEGKPINDETLRSKSPSVNETMNSVSYTNALNASPKGKGANGSAPNGAGGSGSVEVQHGVVAPAVGAGHVEHVVIKKKKGCCVIQ